MSELNFKMIGLKIKERRQDQGITQEMIANYLDVNPSHISNIECGRAHPSLSALIKIANILQCSVDYFIQGEYTFIGNNKLEKSIDDVIIEKIQYCDMDKKRKILSIIDIL
ncbi:MAG: helix-turn-helix transcriptional regulator [Lachnospiraceae bacterium]|nr:helix-turn-helix transcriptional regulator [Lachnospiraceae bacterium]